MKVYVPVASGTVAIVTGAKPLLSQFEKNYFPAFAANPFFTAMVEKTNERKGYWLTLESEKTGTVHIGRHQSVSFRSVNFFLKALIQFCCLRENILLLHGSAFVSGGRGYVFTGPSGAGKTTILRLANGLPVLADDTVVLKREGGSYFVYPSPFDRKKQPGMKGKKTRLAKIFILKQADETQTEPVSKEEAHRALLEGNFLEEYFSLIARNPHLSVATRTHTRLRRAIGDLAGTVPVEKLAFRKDAGFLELL